MSNDAGWVGIDLDGTLAHYDKYGGPEHIGEPIAPMVERVKQFLKEGREVRIFTARCFPIGVVHPDEKLMLYYDQRRQDANLAVAAIRNWCDKHLGRVLTITCVKDFRMDVLYDDRAVQVVKNTGELVGA